MATQKYTTLGKGTLGSSYTAGASSISLSTGGGSSFPSSGDFVVAIDSPPAFFLKCTARSGDTLTVATSAVDGTTAASKAAGVAVTEVVTATVLDGIRSDMQTSGTLASIPNTTEAHKGDIYYPSDSPIIAKYDGAVWIPYGPMHVFTPPVAASFTVGLTNTATVTDTVYGVTITGSNNQSAERYKSAPGSTPFTITMAFHGLLGPEGFAQIMMIGRESSSGKLINFGVQHPSSGRTQLLINKLGNTGGFNSQYFTRDLTEYMFVGSVMWLRIKDDGTNRISQISNDGVLWFTVHSIGRTDYCTCNQFGFQAAGSANYAPCTRIFHWEQV